MPFAPINEVLDDLRHGKMVVLTDDENRENEGDLVLPAQFVTPAAVTFMLAEAKGYMCLSLTEADCDRLELTPQASVNTSVRGTAFTVSLDGHPRHGFTTGVSARERAKCISMCIDPALGPADFVRPGHINPLRSRDGGVLVRTGQTEGSVDLCRLAGLYPAAVIIEIMKDDGEMARVPDLIPFCKRHGIKICSVAQIIQHRLARESLIRRIEPVTGTTIRTRHGEFTLFAFDSLVDPLPHVAIAVGGIGNLDPHGQVLQHDAATLVRMHRRNLLGDVFGELEATVQAAATDGGARAIAGQLERSSADVLAAAMAKIQREGRGAIVYLRPEGQGDTLAQRLNHIRRGATDLGADKPDLQAAEGHAAGAMVGGLPKSMRDFGIGCQILRSLGLKKLRLLTNHATDLPGLEAFGLEVTERVRIND